MTPSEQARLAALHLLQVLDTAATPEFDALVKAASLVCGVPISLISLVDTERQWFKANVGLPGVSETPRNVAFCDHTIRSDALLEVPDATLDARFAGNPLVTGQPDIRFYAGHPLRLSNGQRVGTLCVIDRQPRRLNDTQREVLACLAEAATRLLELHRPQQALIEAGRALADEHQRLLSILEGTQAGTWEWNVHTGEVRINERSAEMIGETLDSLGPQTIALRIHRTHPQDMALSESAALAHLRGGSPIYETETRIRHRKGHWVWILARGRLLSRLPDGRPEWMFGTHQDISAQMAGRLALKDAHARMALATEAGGIGIWDWDLRAGRVAVDPITCRLFDLPAQAELPAGGPQLRRLHGDDIAMARTALMAALRGSRPLDHTFRWLCEDGSVRFLRTAARISRDAGGRAQRMIGALWDVTEPRTLADRLAEQAELLRITLQSIGDAVLTTDVRGRIAWLNPVAERLTGWTSAEAAGLPSSHVFRILDEDTRRTALDPVAQCLANGQVVGLADHTVLVGRHGIEYGIEDSASPIRNERGELVGVVLVFRDVTEQRRLSGEMSYRASHDPLTGLVNRSEFEGRLDRLLQKSRDDRSQHALLYIDLDQFKLVNDACGHTAGDLLLQQVSKLLGDAVRHRDTLARLGGDEFAIILEHCTSEQAQRAAQLVCDRMEDYRFLHDGRRFRIGTSIGLVPVDARWATPAAILQAADTACYAAKEAGRNRVHTWYDTDLTLRNRHGEMQWATRLETALDEGRFVLHAQRITALCAPAGQHHAEVLLRLVDSDGGLVLPGAFLPAAERFNLVTRIDRWVLRQVIDWMQLVPAASQPRMLSVNLSGQSIGDRAFHRWAIEQLRDAGPALCGLLCLEVTETAAVTNLADAALFIDQVRALGVRVALDDFGAGASSFGYLKTLKVDFLKIDGQFIRDLINDPLDEAAVRCFADVARLVGIQTVAEFVDNAPVLERLRGIGIDFAQGFLLHRPSPIDELHLQLQAEPG